MIDYRKNIQYFCLRHTLPGTALISDSSIARDRHENVIGVVMSSGETDLSHPEPTSFMSGSDVCKVLLADRKRLDKHLFHMLFLVERLANRLIFNPVLRF